MNVIRKSSEKTNKGVGSKITKIPDEVLKEIFPRGLNRSLASEWVYSRLKQMILSGKVKEGQRLVQEKIAQKFNVGRNAVGIAFSKLKKDGLIISKRGAGSFIILTIKEYLDLRIYSETYECLFFRQNGGDGLIQRTDDLIPQ